MKRDQIFTPGATLLAVSLIIGIIIAVVNPPFQAPDEPAHLCRAWQIGEGHFFTRGAAANSGDFLPSSIDQFIRRTMDRVPFHPEETFTWRSIAVEWEAPLHPEERTFIFFPGTSMYTPVPYVAQASAAAIGRMTNLSPIGSLVAVRLANLAASTLILLLAIRLVPAGKWSFTALAMTPMALFLRASASGDGMTIALAFLVTALALLLVRNTAEPTHIEIAAFLAASGALALCKPVYFLVPMLVFASGRRSRRHALLLIATCAVTFAGLAFSAGYAHRNFVPMHLHVVVNPSAQLRYLWLHPFRGLSIFIREWLFHAPRYAEQLIGNFGWLDTPLPTIVVLAYALLLVTVLVMEYGHVSMTERLAAFLIVATTVLLITLSQYLSWSPVGGLSVAGVQGRYFLPITAMGAVMIGLKDREIAPRRQLIIGLSIAAAGVITVITIVLRYFAV